MAGADATWRIALDKIEISIDTKVFCDGNRWPMACGVELKGKLLFKTRCDVFANVFIMHSSRSSQGHPLRYTKIKDHSRRIGLRVDSECECECATSSARC